MGKKIESIVVSDMDVCAFCGRPRECIHHIFGGPNKKASDRYKLLLPLCNAHHNMSDESVHFDKDMMRQAHILGQISFEALYGHEKFMKVFGKNYKVNFNEGEPYDE